MRIKVSNGNEEHLEVQYSENSFKMIDQQGECRIEYYPIINIEKEYDPNKFSIVLLNNQRVEYGENCIYQVMVPNNGEKTRIGWIFPIQALESSEHDYVENIHFLRYAYVALYKLLDNDIIVENRTISGIITLEDIYSMDKTLLVIDSENTSQIPAFSLDHYIVSLFSHGYTYTGNGNLYDSCEENKGQYLQLKPLSKTLVELNYVGLLFKNLLPSARDAFYKFHLCYQVIELLISVIFNIEVRRLVDEIKNCVPESDLFKYKEKLDDLTNEKKRVIKLFDSYSSIPSDEKKDLKDFCDSLLDKLNIDIPEKVGESLYAVRCTLVHRCYMINPEDEKLLDMISDIFCGVVIKMLLDFRGPEQELYVETEL